MRKIGLILLALLGAFAATGCQVSGPGEVELVGQFRLEQRLQVTDAMGRARELVAGPARLKFSPGVSGLRAPRLVVEDSRGQRIAVALPESLTDRREGRWTASELGQRFGMRIVRLRESALEHRADGGCRLAVNLRLFLTDARDGALGEFIEDGEHEVPATGARCRR
jgi:hypothetical protein